MASLSKRWSFHLLVSTVLSLAIAIISNYLYSSLTGGGGWRSIATALFAGLIIIVFYWRWQLRVIRDSPDAVDKEVEKLASGEFLSRQVLSRI
jgi:hypothetical protein